MKDPERPKGSGAESGYQAMRETLARREPDGGASVLAEIRLLIDQGQLSAAEKRITAQLKAGASDAGVQAKYHAALSLCLEMQGRYRESFEAVARYDSAEARAPLDAEARGAVGAQLGMACNYLGDHPRAIAILNQTMRDVTGAGSSQQAGAVCVALARVYRSINEYTIARDHARRALECFRDTGDWYGLADAWFAIAVTDVYEGHWEAAIENFEQARTLIGDHPATFLLGKIHNNLAGSCWYLRKPLEGIRHLETAIGYFENTELRANATDGWNNLGINLTVLGEWDRAEEALRRALAMAREIDERGARVPTILDSLGDLYLARGEMDEAAGLLEQAVTIARDHGNKWYEGQALRTLSQCRLEMGAAAQALAGATLALELGQRISDRQGVCESRLLLAEALLATGRPEDCAAQLKVLDEATAASPLDMAITGEAQRVHGLLCLARGDEARAAHHFGRAVSIFEMLGDVYRVALAHYLLGRASAAARPRRAAEHLDKAIATFERLGARQALARARQALGSLDQQVEAPAEDNGAILHMLTMRLTEAGASRELLLRELAAILAEVTAARRVLILAAADNGGAAALEIATGDDWRGAEAAELSRAIANVAGESDLQARAAQLGFDLWQLRPAGAPPVSVLCGPTGVAALPPGLSIEPLLKIVQLGLSACALREREHNREAAAGISEKAGPGLMPGFIHSSPSMTRLVEEILKIRSSDVTVLITGESGTGKELVARAVHAHSSRRSGVFVPFNCTAVPRELSDGYLFGYKRGSFTGAVADSPGVIRAAEGGSLFLDEIGDLPLDIQPKLLRFLQEGEIQPLGQQVPVRVDVRVIAATNTDLEAQVTGGRFREDLFYRLNVIRLRVPPLRERRAEIPAIVSHYIRHYAGKFGRGQMQISPQALDVLMVCDWPGNVRQLTNEIQRLVARAEDGSTILPEHLSPELRRRANSITAAIIAQPPGSGAAVFWRDMSIPAAVDHLKQLMAREALDRNDGNISRAARELQMTRRGLQLLLSRNNEKSEE
ncbi:MAG: sigma 54-interacting transcriptional regulator [Blastocatellia bacterium]